MILPSLPANADAFYLCVKDGPANSLKPFVHQGDDAWLQVKTYNSFIPLWASIVVIVVCISFSALFSGLNLGKLLFAGSGLVQICGLLQV